jgi:two-component system chemotaxis sensor kinase CheA
LAPELHQGFDALGRSIQRLTMVPLSNLFERFRKMVFDLADELDKRVNDMAVEGDDMLVDVTLLDKMRDVLIHALRNCLDHGIEPPAERAAALKPERGTIAVRCYQEEGALHFDIRDDGRGIDPEAVKAVALSKGVADQDALAKMSDEQILRLLFEPGFSTAKQVTDVSGRGVGMDVIRSTMRALKGEAEIESEFGVGTTLRLWIPADYYQRL